MTKYTWVITSPDYDGESSSAVAKIGPSGAKGRLPLGRVVQDGEHFRLMDSDGRVRFTGYIEGEYTGYEPLEDYGRQNGCTEIQYNVGDLWTALDGTITAFQRPQH